MEDDIEPRLDHRGGALIERTFQRLHRQVVAHDEAIEADLAAHDFGDHHRRHRRGAAWINRGVEKMRAHRHRQVAQRRKRGEVALELPARGVDDRQLVMAVHARPAMPGHVLDDRRDAAGKQSVGDRPAHRRHALGPGREGPRADGVVHAFARDIEHRRAVDVDSDFVEIMRDQARDETGRRLGFGWLKPASIAAAAG